MPPGLQETQSKADIKRERKEERRAHSQTMRLAWWGGGGLLIIGGLVWWGIAASGSPDILATRGLHWHSELNIFINGEKVVIPANVGIVSGFIHPHQMHTHQEDNIIHMEIEGVVRRDELKLKHFFEVWDKDFSGESILGNRAGDGKMIKMTVNGTPNTEFGEYEMKDGDKIEVRLE